MSSSGKGYVLPSLFNRGKHRVAFAGDSITFGNSPGQNVFRPLLSGSTQEIGDAPSTYAMAKAVGWELTAQIGYPGYRSDQVRAQLNSSGVLGDVDACVLYSPGYWNDIGGGYSLAQSRANVEGMILDCLAAGVMPILCSSTPDGTLGTSTARKTAAAERFRMTGDLARKYSLPTVDLWGALADYTTAQIKAAYLGGASDVHPNAAGRKAGGEAVAAVLNNLYAGTSLQGIPSAVDSDDILAGYGWFLLDSNADGIGDGWTGANGAGATWSRVADPTFGYIQRCTTNGLAGNNILTLANIPGSGGLAGHVLETSGWSIKSGTSQCQVAVVDNSSFSGLKYDRPGGGFDDVIANGRFSIRHVAQVGGSGKLSVSLLAQAGTGTVDFAGITIRDLTALGLA